MERWYQKNIWITFGVIFVFVRIVDANSTFLDRDLSVLLVLTLCILYWWFDSRRD
jgi:hypothetical protein